MLEFLGALGKKLGLSKGNSFPFYRFSYEFLRYYYLWKPNFQGTGNPHIILKGETI